MSVLQGLMMHGMMMHGMMGARGWLWEDRDIKGSESGERD
jgi:hypothetical protein